MHINVVNIFNKVFALLRSLSSSTTQHTTVLVTVFSQQHPSIAKVVVSVSV